jgi:hypothetical protein
LIFLISRRPKQWPSLIALQLDQDSGHKKIDKLNLLIELQNIGQARYFLFNFVRPINPVPNRSISEIDGKIPSFKATQLIPTRGNKVIRTIVLKLSCFAIKSAKGGEYL